MVSQYNHMPRRTTCKLCTIKLIRKLGRPKAFAMPCNIADCPYDHLFNFGENKHEKENTYQPTHHKI